MHITTAAYFSRTAVNWVFDKDYSWSKKLQIYFYLNYDFVNMLNLDQFRENSFLLQITEVQI